MRGLKNAADTVRIQLTQENKHFICLQLGTKIDMTVKRESVRLQVATHKILHPIKVNKGKQRPS